MNSVSFLIGSGFSVPADYRTTTALNDRLHKIDASEICIHSKGDAWFLMGETDPNAHWMGREQRKFLEEFLRFYNEKVLKPGQSFHYETFYDYYRQFYDGQEYTEELSRFLEGFRQRYHIRPDADRLLLEFNNTFNQLIAQLLTKNLERVHLAKPYHPNYSKFLHLVETLAKTHRVHLHTLNHDLYMEYLAHSDSIRSELDDGFEEIGSPFYGELYVKYERYKVRLSHFRNKFERQFCLYKLHGSIDFFWFQDGDEFVLLRGKRGVSQLDLYKEVARDGKLQYVRDPTNHYPDFLSGTTFKLGQYEKRSYYPTVLEHFTRNLHDSITLIVIGYGFGDSRINEYIDNFLELKNKIMFIVDIRAPNTQYLQRREVHFVDGGVSGIDMQYILNNWSP